MNTSRSLKQIDNIMIKSIFLVTVVVMFCALTSFAAIEVGLVYNDKVPVFQEAVSVFSKQIESSGHKTKIVPYASDEPGLEAAIKSSKCAYFFCVGTQPAKACLSAGLPGVFTMVSNPAKNGLVDQDGVPVGKMTGVLIEINAKTQFSYLQQIMGSRKKAAILYDPSVSSFIVADFVKEATSSGFQIVEFPVSNKDDVPPTVEKVKGKGDFILSVVDNTVYNLQHMQIILRFSIINKIPLIGFSSQQVKAGALLGFYCDYPKLGAQSAKIMETIIGGADVTKIVAETPKHIKYSINIQTANIMKIDFTASIKSGADETYGSE